MSLTTVSLLVGIVAVLCAGIWRCVALLIRIALAIEAVPELAHTVQQLDRRTTILEAERGIT